MFLGWSLGVCTVDKFPASTNGVFLGHVLIPTSLLCVLLGIKLMMGNGQRHYHIHLDICEKINTIMPLSKNKDGLKPRTVPHTASMNKNADSLYCYSFNHLKLLVHSLRPETYSSSSSSWICPHYQTKKKKKTIVLEPSGGGAGSRSPGILTHSPRCLASQLAMLCCITSSDDAAKHHLTGRMGQMAVPLQVPLPP